MINMLRIYFIIINAAAFLIMTADKFFAVKRMYRIPEKVLFSLAVIGGSVGSLAAMYLFHHKTYKPLFKNGVPAALLLHVLFFIYYVLPRIL